MSSKSHRFLTSDGLMPSTIFDRGDTDMDISEEMEEIRELLYEMIKKNFPMGVSSTHLAEKYREEYVSKGLGRELPTDWLQQVAEAEEFEAQTRGPLTILFVRLSNTSSFKRPPVPLTNVRIISAGSLSPEQVKKRKEQYPLQHAKMLKTLLPLSTKSDVLVVEFDNSEIFHVRPETEEQRFKEMQKDLSQYYEENDSESRVQIYEILAGGAYAVCDAGGSWFRVIAEEAPRNGMVKCFFADVGVHASFSVRDVRFLPDPHHHIMETRALCRRACMEMAAGTKSERLDVILKELLFEKNDVGGWTPVKVQLASVDDKKNPCRVELWTMDGRSIKDEAQTRFAEAKENNVETRKCTTTVRSAAKSSIAAFSFDGDAVIEPLDADRMPLDPFTGHALFAAGPADISLRQLSLDPMPDYMYAKLAEESELDESVLPAGASPQIGRFYAAFIDGRWERVQCVRASKIDSAAYCVYLIDVGAFHYVRGDALRCLNAKTPFKKMLVFKCKLSGVEPVGGDVWSRESHEAVREFFEAAVGEAIMVHPSATGWNEWKQQNAPRVPVVEGRVTCGGRDLGQWLVRCGLALPKGCQ